MDITAVAKLIENSGFPMTIALLMGAAHWVIWKRSLSLYEAQHREHREDIMNLITRYENLVAKSTEAIDNVVITFKESQKDYAQKIEMIYQNTESLVKRKR